MIVAMGVGTFTLQAPALAADPLANLTLRPIVARESSEPVLARSNTPINVVPFKLQALTTVGAYQFLSYYDEDGFLVAARRKLTESAWSLTPTRFVSNDPNDHHNVSSIAVDGDGFLHVAWGVHVNPLLYTRSTQPVLNDRPLVLIGQEVGNAAALRGEIPLQPADTTYPAFLNVPDESGDLILVFRTGHPGAGEYQLARWDNAQDAWRSVHTALDSTRGTRQPWIDDGVEEGGVSASPYINGPVFDSRGRLHVTWTWRLASGAPGGPAGLQANRDIMYAFSDDRGETWRSAGGAIYHRQGVHDIDIEIAPPVVEIPQGRSFINTTGMAAGPDGTIYLAASWAPNAAAGNHLRQYMLVSYDGKRWSTSRIGDRHPEGPAGMEDAPISDDQLATVHMSRPAVMADSSNRVFVVLADHQRGGGVTVAYSEREARDDWRFIDLTNEDLGPWEPSFDLNRWREDGVLSMLHLKVDPQAQGSRPFLLEWDARGYFNALAERERARLVAGLKRSGVAGLVMLGLGFAFFKGSGRLRARGGNR